MKDEPFGIPCGGLGREEPISENLDQGQGGCHLNTDDSCLTSGGRRVSVQVPLDKEEKNGGPAN